jgi:heme exporter protein A
MLETQTLITVQDLAFSFPGRQLFSALSFRVHTRELLQIQGSNGVGKSTLVKILAGFIAQTAGTVEVPFLGDKRAIDYLPSEANGLYLKLSAIDNLRFWAELGGQQPTDSALNAHLERVGLAQKMVATHIPVGKFSTGMKRRLALARLVAGNAPLWLLDEPVFGLDAEGISCFREILSSHINQGGGCIIVTHDRAAIEGMAQSQLKLSDYA